ncbi:MAG: site-specific DNA-methyltransferase [Tunicatimonas sp.]
MITLDEKSQLLVDANQIDENVSQIILGDTRHVLENLPSDFYAACITSPPYWGKRDYGVPNQIGAEDDLDEYIENLVVIFREVKQKLKDDGTLWLNLGDSYTSGNRTWRAPDKKNPARSMSYRPPTPQGLKPKDLIGVPWQVALALQKDGWYLRSDIIWYKPNCQPESVKDRPTMSHEYIFLLTKSEKYYYDYLEIKETARSTGKLRNKRSVWQVNTEAFPGAHFATFPRRLIVPMIKAGTKKQDFVLDPFFGAGTVGEVCTNLERNFHGIEINPEYAEMANARLKEMINGRIF